MFLCYSYFWFYKFTTSGDTLSAGFPLFDLLTNIPPSPTGLVIIFGPEF